MAIKTVRQQKLGKQIKRAVLYPETNEEIESFIRICDSIGLTLFVSDWQLHINMISLTAGGHIKKRGLLAADLG